MARDVDAEFGHCPDGQLLNASGLGPGAERFILVAEVGTQQALGHLRAGRVVSADEEDGLFGH